MSTNNSNVIIKNNQVQFSKEVLEYFKSIETVENKEWINKYFRILNNRDNLTAEKYNRHHIRPVFTFKDKEHRNRRQAEKLGNGFNGNTIRVSIYNHLFAHFYLWKIFNNRDSKMAFQRMCGQGKYIDNLTEDELKEIAKLKENCTKENKTREDLLKRMYRYNHSKDRVERIKERDKIRYLDPNVGDYVTRSTILRRISLKKYENILIKNLKTTILNSEEYNRVMANFIEHKQELQKIRKKDFQEKWIKENKDKIRITTKEYSKRYKQRRKELNNRLCLDPKTNTIITYSMLLNRKHKHKDLYKDVILRNCLIEVSKEEYSYLYENRKPKVNHPLHKKDKKKINENNKRMCFDPIRKNKCTYGTLTSRKYENKDLYKNVIVKNCLIQ